MHTLGLGIWGVLPVESFIQIELLGRYSIYICSSFNQQISFVNQALFKVWEIQQWTQQTETQTSWNLQLKEALLLKCILSWERQGEQSLGLFSTHENHLQLLCACRFPFLPVPPASDSLDLRKGNQNIQPSTPGYLMQEIQTTLPSSLLWHSSQTACLDDFSRSQLSGFDSQMVNNNHSWWIPPLN